MAEQPQPPTNPAAGNCAPGDPADWLAAHGDALFRYALLHVGDRERAEDIVQDTLLAAWQARQRFKGQSNERTWLIGILRHKLIDHVRRARRDLETDLDATSDYVAEQFTRRGLWKQGPARWGSNPAQAFESAEFWDVFAFCMSRLPQSMLFAFTEREMVGRNTEETCKVLGTTATNLWTLLHRARTRLRKCLESNWFSARK